MFRGELQALRDAPFVGKEDEAVSVAVPELHNQP